MLRILLVFFVLVIVPVSLLWLWQGTQESPYRGTFEIVNRADETIARLLVSVCGQSFSFRAIESGKRAKGSYSAGAFCHLYSVKARFVSGKKLKQEVEYVSYRGADHHHIIELTDSAASLAKSSVKFSRECSLVDFSQMINCLPP